MQDESKSNKRDFEYWTSSDFNYFVTLFVKLLKEKLENQGSRCASFPRSAFVCLVGRPGRLRCRLGQLGPLTWQLHHAFNAFNAFNAESAFEKSETQTWSWLSSFNLNMPGVHVSNLWQTTFQNPKWLQSRHIGYAWLKTWTWTDVH